MRGSFVGFVAAVFFLQLVADVLAQQPEEVNAKDKLIVEAVLRMESFDYQKASPKVVAAISRFLDAEVATETYFRVVERYRVKTQSETLMRIALDGIAGKEAQAVQILFQLDATDRIVDAVRASDVSDVSRARLLRAVVLTEDPAGVELLNDILKGDLPLSARVAATEALGGIRAGEKILVGLAAEGALPADLAVTAAEVMNLSTDPELKQEAARYLQMSATVESDALPAISELLKRTGDVTKGREVYQRACLICHQIGEEGMVFGPALTEIGDKLPKEALYASIFEPSAAISFGFEGFEFSLNDGTSRVGIVASETDSDVSLRVPGGVSLTVEKSQITARKKLTESLMPKLHSVMAESELVNLIEFLSSLKR